MAPRSLLKELGLQGTDWEQALAAVEDLNPSTALALAPGDRPSRLRRCNRRKRNEDSQDQQSIDADHTVTPSSSYQEPEKLGDLSRSQHLTASHNEPVPTETVRSKNTAKKRRVTTRSPPRGPATEETITLTPPSTCKTGAVSPASTRSEYDTISVLPKTPVAPSNPSIHPSGSPVTVQYPTPGSFDDGPLQDPETAAVNDDLTSKTSETTADTISREPSSSASSYSPSEVPPHTTYLHTLADRLYKDVSNWLTEKPEPSGKPSVWADGRQALCETLPYFRSFQGSGYTSDGIAYAFMFDKEAHWRDWMDSNVIISRASGGKERDDATGSMVTTKDQNENAQVQSVRNNIMQFNPVAIILGKGYPLAPTKLPYAYNVLDWFKPTHVWYEKSNGKRFIKYRFEKLRPDENCWWEKSLTAPEEGACVKLGSLEDPHSQKCGRCGCPSTQVYIQGWMCLQPDCVGFWKLSNDTEPDELALVYDPRFIKCKTAWPINEAPYDLKPGLMEVIENPAFGYNVSWEACKGFCCPHCGRCNSRVAWIGWACEASGCAFSHHLPHVLIQPRVLRDPYAPLSNGPAFSKDKCSSGITRHVEFAGNYRINSFCIPGTGGFIAHLVANRAVNEAAGGPDDMFLEMQRTDMHLRRRPLAMHRVKGAMLMQSYAANYGMPYKFVAATDSYSFEGAAEAIRCTRSRLTWAARHLVGDHPESFQDFNEILALGYMEKQSIDYHDDGEKGLGPTIATLSLGFPATMRLRMKAKYYHGVTKSGSYVDDLPIPGCEHYEARKAAYDEMATLKQNLPPAEIASRTKSLPAQLGLTNKGNARDVLQLHLAHGDIVIMHGRAIQKYFEHAVEPSGKLRFALTSRHIDLHSLAPGDLPSYEVLPDDIHYDGGILPAAPAF